MEGRAEEPFKRKGIKRSEKTTTTSKPVLPPVVFLEPGNQEWFCSARRLWTNSRFPSVRELKCGVTLITGTTERE